MNAISFKEVFIIIFVGSFDTLENFFLILGRGILIFNSMFNIEEVRTILDGFVIFDGFLDNRKNVFMEV